jgi:hypothetical protein
MSTPLLLTPGDIKVFWWLWLLRVLTLDQLRRLRYYQPDTGRLSSADNVRKRLSRLAQAGYLAGDQLQSTRERLYTLTEEGLAALRLYRGLEQRRLYRPRTGDTVGQLLHALMVSEFAARIVESLRGTEVELPALAPLSVPFYHTHAVGDPSSRRHTERFVTHEDLYVPGEPEPLRIRPDLVFGLAVGGARRLFFLEADRGTESLAEVARKQLAYAHYRDAPDPDEPGRLLWQRYGEFQDFRVLVVTTTEQRIASLRRVLLLHGDDHFFALSSLAMLQRQNPILEPVWVTLDGAERSVLRR